MSTHHIDDEHGGTAEVDLHYHGPSIDRYTVVISGELLDRTPEAITAALSIALHEERTDRQRRAVHTDNQG